MNYDDLRSACCECRRLGCDFHVDDEGELVCSCFECSFYKMYDLIKNELKDG